MRAAVRQLRWRDHLLDVVLDGPPRDRRPFWREFDRAAPSHLRAAVRLAALCAVALPLHDPDQLDRLSDRPVLRDLLEVAKVVACFAHFDDDAVQREHRTP